jgi:hypothetical protein
LLLGANQSGKTLGGAAEVAIHLTGLYPSWWDRSALEAPHSRLGRV